MPVPIRGVLGQSAPVATTLTTLYTVPAARNAVGRVIVSNRAGVNASFRIAVAIDGAGDDVKQYIAFDKPIAANDTGSTIAFMAGADDVVKVYASNGNLSFTFTGIEQDD